MLNNRKDTPEIQNALAGRYQFTVGTILKQAWQLTQTSKLPVFSGFLFIVALGSGIEYLITSLMGSNSEATGSATGIASLLSLLISAPFWGGLDMMALQRSRGVLIKVTDVFNYLKFFGPLALVQIIVALMIQIGLILLLLPAVYLAVGTSFCLMLILDKGLTPAQAITVSIRAIHQQWFKVFLVFLAITPVMALGVMPYAMYITGQGMAQVQNTLICSVLLLWAVPMMYYAKGLMFDAIFVASKETAEPEASTEDHNNGSFSA